MNRNKALTPLALFLLFCFLTPLTVFSAVFNFEKIQGISIEVLSSENFQAKFGNNPDVPRTPEAIIEYARKLYPSLEEKRLRAAGVSAAAPEAVREPLVKGEKPASPFVGGCGEYEFGVLFAALQNPAISNATRAQVEDIMRAAEPALPETYSDKHFTIYYTKNDADASNNITDQEAKTLVANLNIYWDKYVKNFKKPQNIADVIEVKVYNLGDGLYGYSGSGYNFIYLHSQYVAKSACNRKTTPAHELFHRVQYSYGYVSGTAGMKWMTEGTASWSQKYTNQSVRDYMGRMNEGLAVPYKPLMSRDDYGYTTAHFWVYLEEKTTWSAIKEVWAEFETNGHVSKDAVATVTADRLSLTFDEFFRNWIKANWIKNYSPAGIFGYKETKTHATSCSTVYGPLAQSYLIATVPFNSTTPEYTHTEPLDIYTADYYEFTLDTTDKNLTSLQITVDGAGALSTFVQVKGASVKKITDGTLNKEVYLATFKPGQLDKIGVIVGGGSGGGNYTISAVPCANLDITGTWDDIYGYVYDLTLNRTTVTGTVDTGYDCGVWNVRGTYTPAPSKLNFTATNPNYADNKDYCTTWFKYTTTLATCDTIEGTWVNAAGFSGSFSMTKRDAAGAPMGATCGSVRTKTDQKLWPGPAQAK